MKYYAYTAVLYFLLSSSKAHTLHQQQSVPLANSASNTSKQISETPCDKATFDACIQDLKKEGSFATALSMLYDSKELRTSYLNQAFAHALIEDLHHSHLIKTALVMTPEFELDLSNTSEIIKKNLDILQKRTQQRCEKMKALLSQANRESIIYQHLLTLHDKKQSCTITPKDNPLPAHAPCNPLLDTAPRAPFNEEEIALVRSMLTQDREVANNFFHQQMKEKNETPNIIRMLCFCLEDVSEALTYADSKQVQEIEQYRKFLENHIATLIADTPPHTHAQHLYNLLKEFNSESQQSPKKRTKGRKPEKSKRLRIADLCS